MIPFVLMKSSASLRKELIVVGVFLVFVLFMPLFTLVAITNVGAHSSSGPAGPDPTNVSLYNGPNYPGDNYAFGNCTYWVYMRRAQAGDQIPNDWGNAATWAFYAQLQGYVVDHKPAPGAVMQISNVDGGLGHVAYVESVDSNGSWHISEMNVVGFDEVDYKAMPESSASAYNFIHGKPL
jgi:surface antigen